MEQVGNMEIISHNSGYRANLTFKQAGGSSKNLHRVEGFVTDKKLVFFKISARYFKGKGTE